MSSQVLAACLLVIAGWSSAASSLSLPSNLIGSKCSLPHNESLFIIGGEPAVISDAPWQVILRRKDSNGNYLYFCGGAIIASSYVVTAGHCMQAYVTKENMEVIVGIDDLRDIDSSNIFTVNDFTTHPQFSKLYNDIAVIKVKGDLLTVPKTKTIPLDRSYTGKVQAKASGFGKMNPADKEAGMSVKLMKVEMNIIDDQTCLDAYGELMIPGKMICTGVDEGEVNGKTVCNGDSGGPLVTGSDFPILTGIVSYGKQEDCTAGPAVFTRVASYASWVDEVMRDKEEWQDPEYGKKYMIAGIVMMVVGATLLIAWVILCVICKKDPKNVVQVTNQLNQL